MPHYFNQKHGTQVQIKPFSFKRKRKLEEDKNKTIKKDSINHTINDNTAISTLKNTTQQRNPKKTEMNLTQLLYLRESATIHQKFHRILKNHLKNNIENTNTWKENYLHRISFETLNTPLNDAILSLDHTGSFMIGIGSISCDAEMEENVVLRFYG